MPVAIRRYYRQLEFQRYYKYLIHSKGGKIMILGCGRSGTTYTSKLFKSYGYSVGHERLGKHGISSWLLVSDKKEVFLGPSYYQLSELDLPSVHQVRHPVKTIASCQSTGHQSWEFLSDEISIDLNKDSKILRGMKYWLYWNLKAEERAIYTYRVENLEESFPKLLEIGGFSTNQKVQKIVSKKTNTRPHSSLEWKDLIKEDENLTNKIKKLALRYGYEIND